ncbi:hypothetical protein, partial [Streptomyces sp. NPDC005077]|uniref:hypothetical protein n=1 Tax=Streptomyces sp. NPDC005077 TaxID=3154292 RepID=UPI0033B10B08
DAMGQAWKGLAQLATGLAITSIPGASALFWTLPDDKLPSWLRDSRTAMKETGKALVAWDEWGKNPGRAAGAVTFNVLTTVFTGGAGAGVSGAGKAGAVAKVLSAAGKAGKVIDPMTYIAKGAGAGLSKIGDIAKGLKGIENIEIPKLPDDAIVLPEGALKLPDGAVHLPEGAAIPDGAVKLPDGNFKLPDDVPVLPEGATKLPTEPGAPARYFDNEYNLLDENGNVLQKVDDARVEGSPDINPDTGADTPHTGIPDREPVLVGAGAHTADTTAHVGANAGDHVIRISDSLDNNLGDIGRTGDNLPGGNIGDNLPGGNAGNHLPGGGVGDHMPTGHAGDNLPSNSLDHAAPGSRVGDHVPGPRTETPGTGPAVGHDVPGGSNADNGLPRHNGPTGPGNADDLGHFADDAGHSADDAAHTADDSGHAADDGDTPANHTDEGTGNGHSGDRELTAAERKQIQDEHIRRANEPDGQWFAKHYDILGRRRSIKVVDGVELPQMVKNAEAKWISRYDLPSGPSETKFGSKPLGTDTVPDGNLPELDNAAANRKASVDLTNTAKAYDEMPTATTEEALAKAKEAYTEQVGDVPNNSKLSEALGEKAAALHVVPHEFPTAEVIELPKTPNGANMFDQVYKLGPDGERLIVEAKAPSGDLDWRHGRADPEDPANPNLGDDGGAQGMRVKQGTRLYIRTILGEMAKRGGRDAEIAAELRTALKEGKLQYVLVKAKDPVGSSYAGAMLEHLKI